MAEKRHPGITMHQLNFGGGFVGLLFAAGSALIFLLGFPTLWYFVALAFGLGIGIALVFRWSNNWRAGREQPLSILDVPGATKTTAASHPTRKPLLLRLYPKPS